MNDRFTVGDVARMAHTTVRALHHYDELGLLVPSRTDGGYRAYTEEDLARLREILLLRQLGVPLSEIGDLLGADTSTRLKVLRAHRDRYEAGVQRAREALAAIDHHIDRMEETMKTEELFEGFEHFDQSEHAGEAEERWGDTPVYAESMRRTRRYGPDDWKRIKDEGRSHLEALASLLRDGRTPVEPESLELAEAMRRHIDRWFYPCPHAMHTRLGAMYESDPRFRAVYEAAGDGGAAFIAAAIRENARRNT